MKYLGVLTLLSLVGCATAPPKLPGSCDETQSIGSCDVDRVYQGAQIFLKVQPLKRPFCAKIEIGYRTADSMQGPWIPLTLFTQPNQDTIPLPPGVGETDLRDCEAFAPKEKK
jgi:hypothetical protein